MSVTHEGGAARQAQRLRRRGRNLRLHAYDAVAGSTAPVRTWAHPVTSVVSPAARLVLLVAAACALLSWRWGWTELSVAAWLLLLVLLVSVPFVLGRHQLEARLDLSRDRVVVGERATGRLLVTNTARTRTLPVTVELPVGAGQAGFDLPSLAPTHTHEELFVIPTSRRAVLTLGPVRSVRADPFHLLQRSQDLDEAQLLHVHPRTVPVEGSAAGLVNDLEGRVTKKLSSSDVSFHALRAYVPGDDRRYIHWKSTARTGSMMVRQFEETKRSHLLVVLSTRVEDYADQAELELAVSAAGSLAVQSLREGQGLSVVTSTHGLRTHSRQSLLDDLAGVDFERQAPRLSLATRAVARAVPEASVAVVVCGSLAQASETRAAARRFAVDVRTVVVQVAPDPESSLRRVADVDVARLARLDDLPAMARRLAR
jgi:uncharacterized protein (DUF58 family)